MIIKADLHLHSCLSPCGDLLMSPSAIVKKLHEKGIALAALTDHNCALNCPAFALLCKQYNIAALFGMELQTSEEIHVLCLFSDLSVALAFSKTVYEGMPSIMNVPEKMGDQIYVDESDDIIGEVDKFLVTSASISIDDVAKRVHELGGLVIPAHVDRAAFSLSSQLGFIIESEWDALEVIRIPSSENTMGYPLTTSSDAHYIEHIARRPFELDLGDLPLFNSDGTTNLEAIKAALIRRPR